MEKKPPIPEDMVKCLSGYFTSKEFEDDLSALFEEVQQAEYAANPDRAKSHAEVSHPHYELGSVIKFFSYAIEDTDECKDIISKITPEQIEAAVKLELEDVRKTAGTAAKNENELNKKEIVEVFRRMIKKEFDHINMEYFPDQIIMSSSTGGAPASVAANEFPVEEGTHAEAGKQSTEAKADPVRVVVQSDAATVDEKKGEEQPLVKEQKETTTAAPAPAVTIVSEEVKKVEEQPGSSAKEEKAGTIVVQKGEVTKPAVSEQQQQSVANVENIVPSAAAVGQEKVKKEEEGVKGEAKKEDEVVNKEAKKEDEVLKGEAKKEDEVVNKGAKKIEEEVKGEANKVEEQVKEGTKKEEEKQQLQQDESKEARKVDKQGNEHVTVEVTKEGVIKEGVTKEGGIKEGVIKEGVIKEGGIKEEVIKEEVVKEGVIKEGGIKEEVIVIKEGVIKEEVIVIKEGVTKEKSTIEQQPIAAAAVQPPKEEEAKPENAPTTELKVEEGKRDVENAASPAVANQQS